MSRRVLFPLRRCPGLVPLRELDDDIVLVAVARPLARMTLAGVLPSVRPESSTTEHPRGV